MLPTLIHDPLMLVLAQAAVAFVATICVVMLALRMGVHLVSDSLVAMLRGFVQIILVGTVLGVLVKGPAWTSAIVLLGMWLAAASIARRRARNVPQSFGIAAISLALGAGSVICLMALLGVMKLQVAYLVPIGSMILTNSMNGCAQLLERFRADVLANKTQIEAGLVLGASREVVAAPYFQAGVRAAMMPQINTLMALGIASIPGLMAGIVLAGGNAVQAGIYQFVALTLIVAASGLTCMIAGVLVRGRLFTSAQQLFVEGQ